MPNKNTPNIILIVLDAVRADHISCYGYPRGTSPNIDALAHNGIKYNNAFSPSIWTPTVHGAIFTGRYPTHSGVYTGSLGLPKHLPVISELLSNEGYKTFATSSGLHLRSERGYDRGFDEFIETYRIRPNFKFASKFLTDNAFRKQTLFSLTNGPDDKTFYKFQKLQEWINHCTEIDAPFFGFINCKTAHQPWNPPRPYKSLFGPPLSRPRYEFIERILENFGRMPQNVDGIDMGRIEQVQRGHPVIAGELDLTSAEWDCIKSWYDGAIRYLDNHIGQLVSHLQSLDVFENTLLVVTSDHGDHFGEKGLSSHMFSLSDHLLHVPLVISPPETSQGKVEINNQVTLIDLFPTFLESAGINYGDEYPLSESLLDFEESRYHDYTFAEYARPTRTIETVERYHPRFNAEARGFDRSLQSVRSDEYKLIKASDGTIELYRWRADPGETDDISSEHPEIVKELCEVIDHDLGTFNSNGGEKEEITNQNLRKHLEHMGYL